MSPTEQECIDRAGEIYGAILADAERAEQIRQAMAERDAHDALVLRIADRVQADANGCLVWQRAKNSRGYGILRINSKTVLAHRVVWELRNGPIALDLTVDHLCRNKACVNTKHMELVTRAENSRRGSPNTGKSHCVRGHRLAGSNVYTAPSGQRECRTCRADLRTGRAS